MARTINCDFPACGQTADYMLTVFANGETRGLCNSHFLQSCASLVLAAGGEELDDETAAAVAALAPSSHAETVDIPPGELWTCQGCGAEFPSEELIAEHIKAEHPTPPDGWEPPENAERETVEAEA